MSTVYNGALEMLQNTKDNLLEKRIEEFAQFATSLRPLIQELQSLECSQSRIRTHAQHAKGLVQIRNVQRVLDKHQQMCEYAEREGDLLSEAQEQKLCDSLSSEQTERISKSLALYEELKQELEGLIAECKISYRVTG